MPHSTLSIARLVGKGRERGNPRTLDRFSEHYACRARVFTLFDARSALSLRSPCRWTGRAPLEIIYRTLSIFSGGRSSPLRSEGPTGFLVEVAFSGVGAGR